MKDTLEARLREKLEATHVEVIDESHLHAGHAGAKDGGGHFRAVIVSERFAGELGTRRSLMGPSRERAPLAWNPKKRICAVDR